MKDYIRLLKFLKPHLKIMFVAVLCMGISAIFDGVSLGMIVPLADKVLTNKRIVINTTRLPQVASHFIDRINSIPPLELLNIMAVSIVVLFFLKGLFGFLRSYLMTDVGQRVIRDVRNCLYQKFQSLSLDFYGQKRVGELASRITYDVCAIQESISRGLSDLIYHSFQIILFGAIIIFIHWRLAAISVLLLPLISFPMVRIGKLLRKLNRRIQERMADINTTLYETLSGARIVKAFSMEAHEIERFNRQNQDFYKLTMKSAGKVQALGPVTEYIGSMGAVVVLLIGGREVIRGVLSFGVFGLFIGSLLSLVKPFKRLSEINAINQQALAGARRIFEILDTHPTVIEKSGATQLSPIRERISFEGVWFRYDNENILEDINLEVRVGEVIAFVGPSGVGKTTLVNLIPRFYDPSLGSVKIDGHDLKNVSLKTLRNQIGIVTQETVLFNDTVKVNIAYGKPDAGDREIMEAAQVANAHAFISQMPKGYDSIIGERGFKLSGGQRQRLAIARAVLKNPPILILDEATSQLDTQSEILVQEAIDRLMKGRTVLVIAHRLSTVRNATKIAVLEGGRIVEFGYHEQLIKKGGLYKRLYEMQFRL